MSRKSWELKNKEIVNTEFKLYTIGHNLKREYTDRNEENEIAGKLGITPHLRTWHPWY